MIRAIWASPSAYLRPGVLRHRPRFVPTIALVVFGAVPAVAYSQAHSGATLEAQQELVDQYCSVCHGDASQLGGFSWSTVDVAHPEQNAPQAEKIIRKLRAGMMPPAGMPRPEAEALTSLAASLEARIDEAAAEHPHADPPALHRINRREYRNSVRDLLDLEIDVNALLPPDGRTGNFDNMADALTVTPALMQGYVRAADKVARLAVGDPHAPPAMTKYEVPKVVNQMRHIEGTPFGTRGGTSVVHNFPADGEYSFLVEIHYYYTGELIGSNLPESLQGQEIEVSVDGERVAVFEIDPLQEETSTVMKTPSVEIEAGPRRVAAAFVSKFDGPVEDQYRLVEQTLMDVSIALHAGMTSLPHLQTLTVTGPLSVTGVSDTPSRQKIFTCYPSSADEEAACTERILMNLAARAFRRPATIEDLEALMAMYDVGRQHDGGFEDGIRTSVQAILAKPEFVFRFERVPKSVQSGETYRVSDVELASRLSYFLWSTSPDEELIEVASQGKLQDEGVLEQQVERLLADPRAEALATDFASQWLRLASIEEIHPEPTIFPDYTRNLAESMRREVELLFANIVDEDRNVMDLLSADYTYVDEVLARHYGIPNVLGNRFRRVPLNDPNRYGLLGKGAIMTLTSLARRTSPVARGKYVLEVLLGAPPPNPPAEVPPFPESVNNEQILSVRERIEQHRASPACAACHQIMDPIGLTLENFDATGRWRSKDGGLPIDTAAEMVDGTPVDGPASLRKALVNRSDAFLGNFTENLLAYGVGRVLDYRDMPAVRAVQQAAAVRDNRFSAFVLGVVKSAPFHMRTFHAASDDEAGNHEDR